MVSYLFISSSVELTGRLCRFQVYKYGFDTFMYCNRIAIMRFTNTSITTRNYRLFLWGKHLRYSLSATFKYIVWSFYRLTGLKGHGPTAALLYSMGITVINFPTSGTPQNLQTRRSVPTIFKFFFIFLI